jgi:hypothetical protein
MLKTSRSLMSCKALAKTVAVAGFLLAAFHPVAHAATTGPVNFTVSATVQSACTLSTPANLVFTYAAMSATAVPATGGGFSVTCTGTLPYTVAVSAASGNLVGLNYTLGVTTASATGSGTAQANAVTGSMVAGQSGICATSACTATATHTVTISY